MIRLGFGLGLFFGSLMLGWWLHRRGRLSQQHAARLARWVSMWPSALALGLLFWQLDLRSVQPWLLPALGLAISIATLLPAWWYLRHDRLSSAQTGSFFACAFFSNVGYLGAVIAFAMYGEAGYGLCLLYYLLFSPCFYTFGFWLGMHYGGQKHETPQATTYRAELRWYPYAGMAAGILLNLVHIPRPIACEWLNHLLIPLNNGLYLLAIGSQLTFESPRPYVRPCVAMAAIKFLYTPLLAWALVSAIHLSGLPRFVVLLEAAMPVAVSPFILPLLFGVDRKLTNAVWLVTTALSLPWLLLYLPLIRL